MEAAIMRQLMQDIPAGVSVTETATGLSAIHRPGCAAAIWQRSPLPSFQSWIDELDPKHLPKGRTILRPHCVRDTVHQICISQGTPDCKERKNLIDDIAALAEVFADLMQARNLRLRLDVVTTNACRKFHVDAVTARLVCTYRGTGTQYGTEQDIDDPQRIFTVPTGAPILLRGTQWQEKPRSGILHRSPPIQGTGETRLVIVIDPITDPADEI